VVLQRVALIAPRHHWLVQAVRADAAPLAHKEKARTRTARLRIPSGAGTVQVDRGRILGLLGGNGAGKTTTLNLILGFLQPDSGTITVTGETAYIPENVALYPELSGLENLRAFAALAGRDLSTQEGENLLARVKLPAEAMSRRLASYSKGMRQRVAIAIALARQAQVFLLDEPTTGLDPAAVQDLATLLRQRVQSGASGQDEKEKETRGLHVRFDLLR
jgi:ABC-2 type transport system ATP-binding protein